MTYFIFLLVCALLLVIPFVLNFCYYKGCENNSIRPKYCLLLLFSLVYTIAVAALLVVFEKLVAQWFDLTEPIGDLLYRFFFLILGEEVGAKLLGLTEELTMFIHFSMVAIVNAAVVLFYLLLKSVYDVVKKIEEWYTRKRKEKRKDEKTNKKIPLLIRLEGKLEKFSQRETVKAAVAILRTALLLTGGVYLVVLLALMLICLAFQAECYQIFIRFYLYPAPLFLFFMEIYFCLKAISLCPSEASAAASKFEPEELDRDKIRAAVRAAYPEHYLGETEGFVLPEFEERALSPVTKEISNLVKGDKRTKRRPLDVYKNGLDEIVKNESSNYLLKGSFFSEFNMYLFRYFSVILARGQNIIFVCNTDVQVDSVYEYVRQGFSEIVGFHYERDKDSGVIENLDTPIWNIVKVYDRHEMYIKPRSILIAKPDYLCSSGFESGFSDFIYFTHTVVFVDVVNSVSLYNLQMTVFDGRFKYLTRQAEKLAKDVTVNEIGEEKYLVKYLARNPRYLCFDESENPGVAGILERVLQAKFSVVNCIYRDAASVADCFKMESEEPLKEINGEKLDLLHGLEAVVYNQGVRHTSSFLRDSSPYAEFSQMMETNDSLRTIYKNNYAEINRYLYDARLYTAIFAMDDRGNLPEVIRRLAAVLGNASALMFIVSKPYMLRDYYVANLRELLPKSPLLMIPVMTDSPHGDKLGKSDMVAKSDVLNLFIRAYTKGVTVEEILALSGERDKTAESMPYVIRELAHKIGIFIDMERFFRDFEYRSSRGFDAAGHYAEESKMWLKGGPIRDYLVGENFSVLSIAGGEEYCLPLTRDRLTQNYLNGQNMIFKGELLNINRIDLRRGRIEAIRTGTSYRGAAFEYVQKRRYTLDLTPERIDYITPVKHIECSARAEDGMSVDEAEISLFYANAEVYTEGYFAVDAETGLRYRTQDSYVRIDDKGDASIARIAYRKYGDFLEEQASYHESEVNEIGTSFAGGMQALALKLSGSFGENADRITLLAVVMINELLRTMYPDKADSVVALPVLHDDKIMLEEEENLFVSYIQPSLRCIGAEGLAENEIGLLIVEDSATELGVLSGLYNSNDINPFQILFEQMRDYLAWFREGKTDGECDPLTASAPYLYYGQEHEPACFDFDGLYALSKLLCKAKAKAMSLDLRKSYVTCCFCGKRIVRNENVTKWNGKYICSDCQALIAGIGPDRDAYLQECWSKSKQFMQSYYGVKINDKGYQLIFDEYEKLSVAMQKLTGTADLRGSDSGALSYLDREKRQVHLEGEVPQVNLCEIMVRQMTHIWQLQNIAELKDPPAESEDRMYAEGLLAYVSVQYLEEAKAQSLCRYRMNYYLNSECDGGKGYRKLRKVLEEETKYKDNPFLYLNDLYKAGIDFHPTEQFQPYIGQLPAKKRKKTDAGKVTYFYYEHLDERLKTAYEKAVAAIQNLEAECEADFAVSDLQRLHDAIRCDHPEFFYYDALSATQTDGKVKLLFRYGATREEVSRLRSQIEAAVPPFTEGIDGSKMSEYEIALRLHTNLVNLIHYDGVELAKEKDSPAEGGIDYLRSICGVFLKKAAVCAGYAHAMTYLLRLYGIEAAFVRGEVAGSGGHAWNLVRLEGEYYHLDATWDDNSNTDQAVKKLDIYYNYFCVTTEEILRSRSIDHSVVQIPECTATACNYYYRNHAVLHSADAGEIKKIVKSFVSRGARYFTFKCDSEQLYRELKGRWIDRPFPDDEVGATFFKIAKVQKFSYSCNDTVRTLTFFLGS